MVTSDLYNVSLTDDKLAILILGAKIIKKSLNDSRFKYTANFYPLETTGTCNCGVPAGKTALSMEKDCTVVCKIVHKIAFVWCETASGEVDV